MLTNAAIVLGTFAFMELVAWAVHKYVLHGFLWSIHKSHHTRHNHLFELNDVSFAFYGVIAALCFIYGTETLDYRFWVGVGISLYGAAYFLVHDLFIHRRLKLFGKTRSTYLRALDIAHKVHHKTKGRDGSESFGMLWVHPKFFRIARKR
ncbi:sterol desaturase family protein [Rufibacter latericius]|uniref:Fatty acid hydroxylase n=1 Tax=Rufibacter latericius TaxID=2487040 RepID=A0A3M9MUT6_9BACT|nr:sterol desaturase family protein [Rufibacter latericius]RNI29292.1 fatty acid hydroxylase [Rufibacter latericius]